MRNFAREHGWQSRRDSNVHTLLSVNQRLLERVEAENAQLRGSVVDLMLKIQALCDVLGHSSPKFNPIGAVGLRAVNRDFVLARAVHAEQHVIRPNGNPARAL